jgi:hypothetical protein
LNEKDMLLACRVLDLYEMVDSIQTLFFEKIPDTLFIMDNHDPAFFEAVFQLVQEKANTSFEGEPLR